MIGSHDGLLSSTTSPFDSSALSLSMPLPPTSPSHIHSTQAKTNNFPNALSPESTQHRSPNNQSQGPSPSSAPVSRTSQRNLHLDNSSQPAFSSHSLDIPETKEDFGITQTSGVNQQILPGASSQESDQPSVLQASGISQQPIVPSPNEISFHYSHSTQPQTSPANSGSDSLILQQRTDSETTDTSDSYRDTVV